MGTSIYLHYHPVIALAYPYFPEPKTGAVPCDPCSQFSEDCYLPSSHKPLTWLTDSKWVSTVSP